MTHRELIEKVDSYISKYYGEPRYFAVHAEYTSLANGTDRYRWIIYIDTPPGELNKRVEGKTAREAWMRLTGEDDPVSILSDLDLDDSHDPAA